MAALRNVLGKNIKKIRKTKKWTQADLAEKVGIEPVSIARIETGLNFPKEENIEAIAEALNVEVKDLFAISLTDKKNALIYIRKTIENLNNRDLEIITTIVKKMTCC